MYSLRRLLATVSVATFFAFASTGIASDEKKIGNYKATTNGSIQPSMFSGVQSSRGVNPSQGSQMQKTTKVGQASHTPPQAKTGQISPSTQMDKKILPRGVDAKREFAKGEPNLSAPNGFKLPAQQGNKATQMPINRQGMKLNSIPSGQGKQQGFAAGEPNPSAPGGLKLPKQGHHPKGYPSSDCWNWKSIGCDWGRYNCWYDNWFGNCYYTPPYDFCYYPAWKYIYPTRVCYASPVCCTQPACSNWDRWNQTEIVTGSTDDSVDTGFLTSSVTNR